MSFISQGVDLLGPNSVAPLASFVISCFIATYATIGYLFESSDNVKTTGFTDILPEYDFIIIGGGTAGAVIAHRLSEISSWKILLIEAGVDETLMSDVPAIAPYLQKSNMDWQFQTEPQPNACLAMKNGRCNWPTGKSLGGTSTINNMLYVRGNKKDFDGWAAMGNTGWSYNEVLPYFKKSEGYINSTYPASPFHGTGGYLTVSDPIFKTSLGEAFLNAGVEMGYPTVDINGAQQRGFSFAQGTMKNGRRCSTARAFLRPLRNRTNLHIAMNAFVQRININFYTKRVESINMFKDYLPLTIRVRKEVILSAGAINSAHLLMLSGVGPKTDLQAAGVPFLKDLNVGRNLQDHVALGGLTFLINDSVSIVQERTLNLENFYQYVGKATGPYTLKGGVEAVGFINTKYANVSGDYPDIELHFVPSPISSDGGYPKTIHGLNDTFYDAVYGNIINRDAWSILPTLLRPKSRGYIKITSWNPFIRPAIYPNYFNDSRDLEVLREGVKFASSLANTTAMRKFGSRVHSVPFPACANLTFMSDAYIDCAVKQYTFTVYHPSGTCKMGPANDTSAVVDPQLRVHGISGLRVIDASIMPTIVSGDINAAVIMIAEKGSDFIIATHNITTTINTGNYTGTFNNTGNYTGTFNNTGNYTGTFNNTGNYTGTFNNTGNYTRINVTLPVLF